MLTENTPAFCKQRTCPDEITLMAYRVNELPMFTRRSIDAHIVDCDFCGAEAQLLGQEGSLMFDEATPLVPFALLALATNLLPLLASAVQ